MSRPRATDAARCMFRTRWRVALAGASSAQAWAGGSGVGGRLRRGRGGSGVREGGLRGGDFTRIGRVLASKPESRDPARPAPLGLITDWGGVLTVPVAAAVTAWLGGDSIDLSGYRSLIAQWVGAAYSGAGLFKPSPPLLRADTQPDEVSALAAAP